VIDMDVGRAQWELRESAKHLRQIVDADPEARSQLDEDMLDETLAAFMGVVGVRSIEQARLAREEARAAA
jgi:hypothetical protein